MDPASGNRPRSLLVQFGLLAGLAATLITGCRHNNAINFATSTQFGVKVGVNAEKIPEVQVGYNRQEAARVPVYVEEDKKASGKTSNPGDPSISSILRTAQASLDDSNTKDAAIKAIRGLESKLDKSLKTNAVYRSLIEEAGNGTNPDVGVLKLYIQAALDLPDEIQRFNEKGKFIATREGDKAADAYSILGTFSGAGAGSMSTNSARLKIAQFFATGIAAQELARYGGAATVNPNAKSPDTLSVDERAEEREIGKQMAEDSATLDEVAEKIFTPNPPATADATARKKAATKALRGCTLPLVGGKPSTPEGEANMFSEMKSASAVRNRLRNHYRGQGQKMLENLQQP